MQTFAIVPAAGRSRRMGEPKLLLPWGGSTIIAHVLAAWRASRVDRVIMVVHRHDERLADLGRAGGAEVLVPTVPPDEMKESVRIALEHAARYQPVASDAWLLAPADIPGLQTLVIDKLVDAYQAGLAGGETAPIWVPSSHARRGHPVLFAWSLAAEVSQLAADEGVNALLSRNLVRSVEVHEDAISTDLDTPEDYNQLRGRFEG